MSKVRAAVAGLLSALTLTGAVPARALGDTRLAWERRDTQLHIAASFGAGAAGTELLYRWAKVPRRKAALFASAAVLAAGVIKEFAIDKKASGSDLMANGVGVGANAALQFTIRF